MPFVLAAALGVAVGLNPYVTVAIVSLLALRTDLVVASDPFAFVATSGVFVVALLLLPIDLFADKFPSSSGWMDRASWVIRPAAGGMLGGTVMTGELGAIVVGVVLGAIVAGGSHALRVRVRQRLQWRLFGFGRIVLGAYGDLSSGMVALLAVLSPPLGIVIAALIIAVAAVADRRWGAPELS